MDSPDLCKNSDKLMKPEATTAIGRLDLLSRGSLQIGQAVRPMLSFDTAALGHDAYAYPLRWARRFNRPKETGQPIVDPDVIEIRLMTPGAITCDIQ